MSGSWIPEWVREGKVAYERGVLDKGVPGSVLEAGLRAQVKRSGVCEELGSPFWVVFVGEGSCQLPGGPGICIPVETPRLECLLVQKSHCFQMHFLG